MPGVYGIFLNLRIKCKASMCLLMISLLIRFSRSAGLFNGCKSSSSTDNNLNLTFKPFQLQKNENQVPIKRFLNDPYAKVSLNKTTFRKGDV